MIRREELLSAKSARTATLVLLVVAAILALQALWFFHRTTPRIEQANAQLYALTVENSQRSLYADIASRVKALADTEAEGNTDGSTLGSAFKDFENHFQAAPDEAILAFAQQLPALMAGNRAEQEVIRDFEQRVARLQDLYTDSYKELLDELRRPSLALWPMAGILADRSGFRQAVTMNRALYLSQTGEIGTARVMLAGLNASVDDPDLLASVYYTLGRLQFELFRTTPDVEYYTQSIQYLRQALIANPELKLAQRLLDFLLSLPQSATAPEAAEGRPETPSEGEGAAVSAEKRIF